jgi:hypothetical protein
LFVLAAEHRRAPAVFLDARRGCKEAGCCVSSAGRGWRKRCTGQRRTGRRSRHESTTLRERAALEQAIRDRAGRTGDLAVTATCSFSADDRARLRGGSVASRWPDSAPLLRSSGRLSVIPRSSPSGVGCRAWQAVDESGETALPAPGLADDDLAAVGTYRLCARDGSRWRDHSRALPQGDFA